MKPFRRTKLKKIIVLEDQKIIQINSKTWIEVPVSVPDDVAREHFLNNVHDNAPVPRPYDRSNYIIE
jgi:hypothetical protein